MTTVTFTEKQRQAIEAMEGARSEGVALSKYAEAHGLIIRELYDAIACLRRKGLLPRPTSTDPHPMVRSGGFVAAQNLQVRLIAVVRRQTSRRCCRRISEASCSSRACKVTPRSKFQAPQRSCAAQPFWPYSCS